MFPNEVPIMLVLEDSCKEKNMKITIACHLLPSRLAIMKKSDNIQVENMEEHEFFVHCQGLWQRESQIQTDRRIVEDSCLQSWTRMSSAVWYSHFTPRYEVLTNRNMHKGTHSRRYMQKYSWQQYSWRHTKRKNPNIYQIPTIQV